MTRYAAYLAQLPTTELIRQRPPAVQWRSYPDSPPEPATDLDAAALDEWQEAYDEALTARFEAETAEEAA